MANKQILPAFGVRTLSAVILLPIILVIIYTGGLYFNVLVLLCALLMSYEWHNMVRLKPSIWWYFGEVMYVVCTCVAMIYLRETDLLLLLWVCCVVWCTDIGAYLIGSIIGGPKILPNISPKKSWSGLAGGMALALLASYLLDFLAPHHFKQWLVASAPLMAVVAQVGDFFESWMKRYFGVKDSGNLIPGHGGILDRVDGLAPVSIIVTLLHL